MAEVKIPRNENACSSCYKTQGHDKCSHVVCPKRKPWRADDTPENAEYMFDGAYKIKAQLGED